MSYIAAFSSTPSINGQKGILTFVNEVKDKNKVPVDDVVSPTQRRTVCKPLGLLVLIANFCQIIYCSEERLKRRPRDPLGSLYDPCKKPQSVSRTISMLIY